MINLWRLSLWVPLLCFPKKKPKGKQTTCVRHAANQVQQPRIRIKNKSPAVQISRRRALRVLCYTCRLVGLGRGRSMRICQARTRARAPGIVLGSYAPLDRRGDLKAKVCRILLRVVTRAVEGCHKSLTCSLTIIPRLRKLSLSP